MFDMKKWNAVAMWSWNISTDTCTICRNNLCALQHVVSRTACSHHVCTRKNISVSWQQHL